jgi:hypothetical protein
MSDIDVRVDLTKPEVFLSKVISDNTRPDGSLKDPNLLRRMENDICRKCHLDYRTKYPNEIFKIKCHGIYDDRDYKEIQNVQVEEFPDDDPMTIGEVKEVFDVSYWAYNNIVVKSDSGEFIPFVARWYQEEVLRCTARHKVDRWGRGLGKTTCGVIEELHKVLTNKNYDLMVVCPADNMSEKWFNEIEQQIENSPAIKSAKLRQKQKPYKLFKFKNGSSISIFTAGSASGRGANNVRSQSPRKIRAEEQDYLAEKDWEAIGPLIERYSMAEINPSEFHGSSTPTGYRGKFWEMCRNDPQYREFYFPISVHPQWCDEMEFRCRKEAKTQEGYSHEYLAEFGDPAAGVFKAAFIDQAKKKYYNSKWPAYNGYLTCEYNETYKYVMGVDWNGEGTGTKIYVVGYNPESKIRRIVDHATVDTPTSTAEDSIAKIVELNKKWHCVDILIDHGFGHVQDQLLKKVGFNSDDPDTMRLRDVKVIDFGANLETNKIIPNRDRLTKYIDDKNEKIERRAKPFMVEGAVMVFEHGLVEFSDEDYLLEEQLRCYRVKTYSAHGYANTYNTEGNCGDHNLDAFMLALLGIELKFGLFQTNESIRRSVQIFHTGWGVPSTINSGMMTDNTLEQKKHIAGVPSRTASGDKNAEYRMLYLLRQGAMIAPPIKQNSKPNSRTAIFRKPPYRSNR